MSNRETDEHHGYTYIYVAIRDAFDSVRRQLEDYARRRRAQVKTHEGPPHGRVVEHYQTEAMPSFSSVDEDKDGYISVQEASTVPAIQFSAADKDGDRRLSPDEYTAAGGKDADETDEEG